VPSNATTILLAYDGSAAAEAALRAAGALFPGARALVVTAGRDPLTFQQAAEATLANVPPGVVASGVDALNRAAEEEAADTAGAGTRAAETAGLAAEAKVTHAGGSPWHGLARLAEEIGADVLVCGTRGRGAVSRAAVGSTSTGLLHHARRPVLVVPEEAAGLAGPLVIGYDGSRSARAAVAGAGRLFAGRDAIVVNVWESTIRRSLSGKAIAAIPNEEIHAIARDVDEYHREGALAVAADGAALAREHGVEARPEAVEAAGAAWHGLLAAARTASAAAIVAGSRGRGAVASTVLGSVSSGLVHNANVPVLVVPGHDE